MYHLFISHSWKYGDAYERLMRLLRSQPQLPFRDFSVPSHRPITGSPTDADLEQALVDKMRRCSVVLIMAGVYATYSYWIAREIAIAQRLGKPIIAIKPWGAERISAPVRQAAHQECAWNSGSIAKAIITWAS